MRWGANGRASFLVVAGCSQRVGARSHGDWSLLGLQCTKAVPFPSGSFSPLPLPPQYNKISFPFFKFGVPFHIPFGIDVAGVTGFFGVSICLVGRCPWSCTISGLENPILHTASFLWETGDSFSISSSGLILKFFSILMKNGDGKEYCHRTMELWLWFHNWCIWSHVLLALFHCFSQWQNTTSPCLWHWGTPDPTSIFWEH